MLVAFEGIDGAGKSTLIREVAYLLWTKNIKGGIIAFPSTSKYGKLAKSIISTGINLDNLQKVCYLDFLSMQPKLVSNELVLLDRYIWSNIVYNSNINTYFNYDQLKLPDLTVYIDVDPIIAFSRSQTDKLTSSLDRQKERQSAYELLTKQIESDKLLFVHRNEVNKVELVTNIICSKMINKY